MGPIDFVKQPLLRLYFTDLPVADQELRTLSFTDALLFRIYFAPPATYMHRGLRPPAAFRLDAQSTAPYTPWCEAPRPRTPLALRVLTAPPLCFAGACTQVCTHVCTCWRGQLPAWWRRQCGCWSRWRRSDGSGSSAAQPTRRESRDKLHAPKKQGPVLKQQKNTIRLLGKVPALLALLVAAVAANVELSFGSPATRVAKRSLLDEDCWDHLAPSTRAEVGTAARGYRE